MGVRRERRGWLERGEEIQNGAEEGSDGRVCGRKGKVKKIGSGSKGIGFALEAIDPVRPKTQKGRGVGGICRPDTRLRPVP